MQFSWPIFATVLALGVVQLAVGVVIGRCLPIRQRKPLRPDGRRAEAGQLAHAAGRLQELVHQVCDRVSQHQKQIAQVNRTLSAAEKSDPADLSQFVLRTVAEIADINGQLQTRLSAAEQRLEEQAEQIEAHVVEARTDPLTRLPNRRAFEDELVRRIAEWQRRHTPFCLLMIDLDHFKRINDQWGHLAGDHVLRRVGELLLRTRRETDLVARIGGEEFTIVLPATLAADARTAAERLRRAVAAEHFAFEGEPLAVTVSVGATVVQGGDDPVALVQRADEALYAAKRAGRDCGFFHNGVTCQRIELLAPPDADLKKVCDNLRQRVEEVVREPDDDTSSRRTEFHSVLSGTE
jgi:diguanylate cyclase